MEITVDKNHGVMYIKFNEEKVHSSSRIGDTIIADYTEEGKLIGIEIIDKQVKQPLKLEID